MMVQTRMDQMLLQSSQNSADPYNYGGGRRQFTLVVPSNAAWEKAQMNFHKAYNTLTDGQFPQYVRCFLIFLLHSQLSNWELFFRRWEFCNGTWKVANEDILSKSWSNWLVEVQEDPWIWWLDDWNLLNWANSILVRHIVWKSSKMSHFFNFGISHQIIVLFENWLHSNCFARNFVWRDFFAIFKHRVSLQLLFSSFRCV